MGTKIKQINNLSLKRGTDGFYRVYAPGNICLEEFADRVTAENWMRNTKDYLKKPGR